MPALEREIKCLPKLHLIKLCGMWHRLVETTCHANQAYILGKKKIGYQLTVALTIHNYVTIRSIFEEVRSNNVTKILN